MSLKGKPVCFLEATTCGYSLSPTRCANPFVCSISQPHKVSSTINSTQRQRHRSLEWSSHSPEVTRRVLGRARICSEVLGLSALGIRHMEPLPPVPFGQQTHLRASRQRITPLPLRSLCERILESLGNTSWNSLTRPGRAVSLPTPSVWASEDKYKGQRQTELGRITY